MLRNRLLRFLLITLATLIPVFAWISSAAPSQSIVGDGTPGSCTESALKTAVAQGGSVLFNCGAVPVVITVTSAITINHTTAIDGNGLVTLSGGTTTRIFYINTAVNFALSRLTLGNANDSAIANHGHLTLQQCALINNGNPYLYYRTGIGSAIVNEGDVIITDCSFSHNGAALGGAVVNSGTMTITNSTFTSNASGNEYSILPASGGAIHNYGNLVLQKCTFTNNVVAYYYGYIPYDSRGGAITNEGDLTVMGCLFSGNAAAWGGALFNNAAMTITNSTFTGNRSGHYGVEGGGGAIGNYGVGTIRHTAFQENSTEGSYMDEGFTYGHGGAIRNWGELTILASLFTENVAEWWAYGGAIDNSGTLFLTNDTISGNSADGAGGGIYNTGQATINNNTVVDNVSVWGENIWTNLPISLSNSIIAHGDCVGTIVSHGHNIDSANTCGLDATNDFVNTDPQLSPLQSNGGDMPSHALLPGSPGIDAGDNTVCPAVDQRGGFRPVDGDGDGLAICDIGSYEAGLRWYYFPLIRK